ncbi:MAG TPA: ferritin-like domain-containing protein [Anaerolineaceae bacterium]
MAGKVKTLEDLLVEQLKDLYSAEGQLVHALPKMAKAATNPELRMGFEQHLEQTRQQQQRIEQMFEHLEGSPRGKKCVGMEGLIKEGDEVLQEDMDPQVRDAALIAAAQKVEHYEISGYGTAATYADMLGKKEVGALLKQTLSEEEMTDQKLTKMAKMRVNWDAKK